MEAPQFSSSVAGLCTPITSPESQRSLDTNTNKSATAGCNQFVVEDLLNFPTDDVVGGDGTFDNVTGSSTDSSAIAAIDSRNSSGLSTHQPSFNGGTSDVGRCGFADGQFSTDLCIPYDDMAELEWLSTFVEESFSSEDQQNLHLISGMSSRTTDEASETTADECQTCLGGGDSSSPMFHSDMMVPAKARSKRSRAAPCNWVSRLLVLSADTLSPEDRTVIIPAPDSPSSPILPPQGVVAVPSGGKKRLTPKKKQSADGVATDGAVGGREARKCLHCAMDTTPQWRTGPMGPKTLCNACGVRYKSGRLVPEYRPAASPTFVLTKHSNSHRKVLELRRQKETVRAQQLFQQPQQPQFLPNNNGQNNMVYDGESSEDGYLIHQHVCPDYRHLI